MKPLALAFALLLAPAALARQAPQDAAKDPLAGIEFLVGHWTSDDGKVADTGGTSKGSSDITPEANGHALLRRDHTDLFDAQGKPAGGFEQIMLIYPENGTLHADYTDGQHVIHYAGATVVPGKSVVFSSAANAGAPVFRLSYALQDARTLSIGFGMIPPGQTELREIARGTARKTP